MNQNIWFQSEVRAFLPRIERLLPHLPKDKRTMLETISNGEKMDNLDLSGGLPALLDKWEYLYLEDFNV